MFIEPSPHPYATDDADPATKPLWLVPEQPRNYSDIPRTHIDQPKIVKALGARVLDMTIPGQSAFEWQLTDGTTIRQPSRVPGAAIRPH